MTSTEILCIQIQMKATEQYFPVVLFILCKVVLSHAFAIVWPLR